MSDREWVEETKKIVSHLNCHLNEDVFERLLSLYLMEEDPQERLRIKSEVESVLGLYVPLLLFSKKPMLPSPKKEEIAGEIKIGVVVQGEKTLYPFALSKEELNQHMLITARSGAGKTTLIIQIIRQLLALGIPFFITDFKQDYRHLIRHYPQLLVINWKDLRINPLKPPPGVSFQEWKTQILSIFGHVEGVWKGSTQYLLEAIDEVYEEKGDRITIGDVLAKIREKNETNRKLQDYASVVETRLYGLISKLGDTINSENSLDVERLLEKPVVLELSGLGRDEANIIVLYFFYWIYAYRRAQGIRGRLLHVLIIDEAKRVFTATEQYSQTTAEYSGIPPADLVCDEIRDFGEAIIASDQEPTKLSNSLKANTYTKITGFLGNGKDINDMAEAMDLSEEREAITKLERGEWLIKLGGRYTKPFIIRSEDFPLEKNVTDEEVREHMKPVLNKLMPKEEKASTDAETHKPKVVLKVSDDAWSLLLDINSHPFKGLVARYKTLGLSTRKCDAAKTELIQKQLVKEVSIKLSTRRPTKFLVLTSRGLKLLKDAGQDTELWERVGKQGYEHQLYSVLIAYSYRKSGCQAFVERKIADRRVDVLVISRNKKIAIEVELGSPYLKEKLKILRYVDQLIIVGREESLAETKLWLERYPQDVRARVSIYPIVKFLHYLRSNHSMKSSGKNSFRRNKFNSASNLRNKSGKRWNK